MVTKEQIENALKQVLSDEGLESEDNIKQYEIWSIKKAFNGLLEQLADDAETGDEDDDDIEEPDNEDDVDE